MKNISSELENDAWMGLGDERVFCNATITGLHRRGRTRHHGQDWECATSVMPLMETDWVPKGWISNLPSNVSQFLLVPL